MDIVNKKKRSEMMSNIKGKNTLPEIMVRKYLSSINNCLEIKKLSLINRLSWFRESINQISTQVDICLVRRSYW